MFAAGKMMFARPFGISTAAAYRAAVLADSPVAYWRLGEASGTVAADETGTYPGTYVGSPTLGASGVFAGDSAVTFNGSSQRATVADAVGLRITGAFTIEVWVKFSSAQVNKGICGKYDTATANRAWVLYTANDGSGQKIQFTAQTSGGSFNTNAVATTANNLDDGAWHHVVGVFNPSTILRIYVDGVAGANASIIPASIFASTATLEIAAYNQAKNYFNGSIDEVAIYPTALSATRIAAHYAAAGY